MHLYRYFNRPTPATYVQQPANKVIIQGGESAQRTPPNSIDNYVDKKYELVTDPNKKTIYVILQEHAMEYPGFSKELREETALQTAQNQVAIFRIVEDLYKRGELELLVLEGIRHDDFADINQTQSEMRARSPEVADMIENGNDEALRYIIVNSRDGGANIAGYLYTGLKMTGFEELATAGTDENLRQGMQSKEGIENLFYRDRMIRSSNALKYALQHSTNFYQTGVIKNPNVGIVIGTYHAVDFLDIAKDVSERKTDYNMVLIFPKGGSLSGLK